jgi:uncharacterized protein with NRDE domain
MCLVAFAYRTDLGSRLGYDLVLIANRDEFFNRPAEPAHFWKDAPNILAGRDIQAGGTWMGVARDGRFALLTNYRDPSRIRTNVKSRGLLVSDFLNASVSAREYLESVRAHAHEYNDFNLLAGSADGIFNFSSLNVSTNASPSGSQVQEVGPGLYGMSNHLFETPWPKVVRARSGLKHALDGQLSEENLFQILADPTPAPDNELPQTGVGIEKERGLSSIFITLPGYGTRCSTLLLMKPDGEIQYRERTFEPDRKGPPLTVSFDFYKQSL